ncbi:unnamed protein product [Prunus armeniaca]
MTHELFEACANVGMMVVNSGLNCKNCEMKCERQVTPKVRSELKPKLGLEFYCCDNVFNFYNMYAAKVGFGIRYSTMRTCTLTGEVTRKEYVCCKQGYALTSTISRKRRRRGCTRTGCKAKLAILKVKDKNKYIVVGFNEVHNHDMTTVDKVHLLRSHRNLTESTKVYSAFEQDETYCRYKVSEWVNPGVTRMKELVHDKVANKAYCSCKGFEFWGIPCRHILTFLRIKQVEHLPDKYILKRWLQSAKSGVIYDENHKEVNDCIDGLLLVKGSKVCKVASDLIDSALLCDEGFELLENSFEYSRGKLTSLVSSRAHVEEPNEDVGTSYPQLRIKDPHRVKVRGHAKRVKGEKDKAAKRHKYRCTECRKADHDRRSCPKLASPSSSSDTELGGPVGENLQPIQSTQDSETTMTESFMQEFDFMYGPGV